MKLIDVQNICKKYSGFELKNVSLSLEEGYIMGFIGRNGAGKTTTIKSMLNLVHPDSGTVRINGYDLTENELAVRQSTGYVSGGVDFYPHTNIKKLTSVTRRFYTEWDEQRYRELLDRFEIDENKKVKELSAGMKVKYSLAVALSHNARLLLLDEPTSGLDPAARDDLLCIFQEYIEDGAHSILFSTHITSDLEKCADFITYIKDGTILAETDRDSFKQSYVLVSGTKEQLTEGVRQHLIGMHTHPLGFEGMLHVEDRSLADGLETAEPSLDDIMVHIERRGDK
ncbi:MAG: ABC transporter ATP-binding protein [Treponema sp.]|nr:ABC transporter ATP-binding protein [Treponema sp.]